MIHLPTLYQKTKTGAIQQWTIGVKQVPIGLHRWGGEIFTIYGQADGQMQEASERIEQGKNLGKKNATTALEQAELEAKQRWTKQLKKGYVESFKRAQAGESDLQGIEPMKAHNYGTIFEGIFTDEHSSKIKFSCAVQPKLDGYRAVTDSEYVLRSKTQKPWVSVPHINSAILSLDLPEAPPLDGELYNHLYKKNFESISSIVGQKKQVHPDHKLVQYHVYDLALPGVVFFERLVRLNELRAKLAPESPIKIVETHIVHNHAEALVHFRRWRQDGYEGLMFRNLNALYEHDRSYDLLKLKEFDDAEFAVIGQVEGKGKLAGCCGTFVCKTPAGDEFEATPAEDLGGEEKARLFWEHPEECIGKTVTVKFQGYTGKNKVPRFGKAIRFRRPE